VGKDKREIAAVIRMGCADGEKKGEERKGNGGNVNKEGIRKELLEEGSSIEVKEGIMVGRVKNGGER